MIGFFTTNTTFIGHNIYRFDIPVVERLLNIKVRARLIDTLALSWYLYPDRLKHDLESWGEDFGIEKPPVTDWENLSIEEYKYRCEEDVKINAKLWDKQWKHLVKLYGSEEEANRFINYLMEKMDCARQQEADGWKLDVDKVVRLLSEYQVEYDKKVEALKNAMPKLPIVKIREKPSKLYLKGKLGVLTKAGEAWYELLSRVGLPNDREEPVEETVGFEEPNPSSPVQIKNWLYSLGWEPASFDYKRNKETNDIKKIPQIKNKQDDSGGICQSIKDLYVVEPALEVLDGLSILGHRIGILKGFKENVDARAYVQARIQGFTNTLRFKHRVVVNLPGVDKPYGADIRSCLIAPEGFELAGADCKGLEDRTKQHYMWKYDPEYVKEMSTPGYDPHTSLAVFAGAITKEQEQAYKDGDKSIKSLRHAWKQGNYACVYGAKPPTVARSVKCSIETAEHIVDSYWRKNWSVLKIAEDCVVKTVNGQKWLFNPVSGFWLSLRYEKDRFSTLNQSTGVFCFDTWISNVRKKRKQITGQMHDEGIWCIKEGWRVRFEELLREAMKETNEQLKLNIELDIDVQFGKDYATIH